MKTLLVVCATILGTLAVPPPLPQYLGHKTQISESQRNSSSVKQTATPVNVKFCTNDNFEGNCVEITVTQGCHPMPFGYDNDVTSVDTNGGCVFIFDLYDTYDNDCYGTNKVLSDTIGTGYVSNLNTLSFDNKISGVASC